MRLIKNKISGSSNRELIPTGRGNKLANIKYHTSAKFIVTNMDCLDNYLTLSIYLLLLTLGIKIKKK